MRCGTHHGYDFLLTPNPTHTPHLLLNCLAQARASHSKKRLDRPQFPRQSCSYVFQSTLAALALAAILLVETGFSNAAINASIASSVFLVFVVPHSVASSTRRVVGGHIVGALVGVAAYGILMLILGDPAEMSRQSVAIAGAASVGVAILLMALTNTEHPPSAGTALSLVAIGGTVGATYGTILDAVWFIISAAIILALVRFILRHWLVNLF